MQVNVQVSNGSYANYDNRAASKVTQKTKFAFTENVSDGAKDFQREYSKSEHMASRSTEEYYQEMVSQSAAKVLPISKQAETMKPLGIGFVFVGSMGYGMSASQVIRDDTEDTIVRVKITLGENKYTMYDVNLSEVDPSSATAVEMFALCQYADANGTGVSDTFGSWYALKSFVVPAGQTLEFGSLEEVADKKINWSKALSKSTFTLEKQSTKETISVSDIFKMLKATLIEEHKLTKESIKKEDDWRKMSEEQWDKFMEHIDKYIDKVKEELEKKKELQEEAARKGAANAPAYRKATAASKAALAAVVNGTAEVGIAENDASSLEEISWTYHLQTEDPTILAAAKMANEFAPDMLSKAQELALTGDTSVGISEVDNRKECASLNEDWEKKKTWIITTFTDQGILCKECTDGVTKELWRMDYKNFGEAQKVWDFLGKFDKNADLKFAGTKSFWEDFLAGKISEREIHHT